MRARQPRSYRILMTADAVGGVWSYALRLAAAFGERAEVLLAVMGPPPTSAQHAAAQSIKSMRVVIGDYPLEWMPGAERDIAAAGRWLLAHAGDFAPDIIHVNGYAAASERWRRPVLVVGHSCVLSWWRAVHGAPAPPEWDGYAERVAEGLAAAHRVVAPTYTMLEDLRRHYGAPGDGGRVIPNGCSAAPCSGGKEKIVLAAGRLWDEAKNLAALDRAAQHVSWPVFVAGDCRHPDGRVAMSHCARALGVLDGPALEAWMSRAALFAAPARYEPFGLSVLEAATAGCALILGDIPSLRELWDGAALFVPPDDDRMLANAIDRLMRDDALRDVFAKAAHRRSLRYSVEAMATAYLSLYDEMTGNAQARPQLAEVG